MKAKYFPDIIDEETNMEWLRNLTKVYSFSDPKINQHLTYDNLD